MPITGSTRTNMIHSAFLAVSMELFTASTIAIISNTRIISPINAPIRTSDFYFAVLFRTLPLFHLSGFFFHIFLFFLCFFLGVLLRFLRFSIGFFLGLICVFLGFFGLPVSFFLG